MRRFKKWTPKEKRDEIVAAYLCGENSYEELGKYYGIDPHTIRTWVCRYRKSDQLWVSDITYIDLVDGCCYLHLVTDAYSKKIVGWCLAESLASVFTLQALRMAIEQAGGGNLSGLIHHSDRGIQYCCDLYVDELQKHNIQISMTEDYKPTDNGIAERVNETIKNESIYQQERRFATYKEALEQIKRFIDFYNNKRPHYSIGLQTPNAAHRQTGEQSLRINP